MWRNRRVTLRVELCLGWKMRLALALVLGLPFLSGQTCAPSRILPVLQRLLEQGGMFHRNGSGALSLCYVACGRLLGYVEPHINSWDCLAAIAVIEGAGGRTNDFLAGDALLRGNRIVAGPPAMFDQLAALLDDE